MLPKLCVLQVDVSHNRGVLQLSPKAGRLFNWFPEKTRLSPTEGFVSKRGPSNNCLFSFWSPFKTIPKRVPSTKDRPRSRPRASPPPCPPRVLAPAPATPQPGTGASRFWRRGGSAPQWEQGRSMQNILQKWLWVKKTQMESWYMETWTKTCGLLVVEFRPISSSFSMSTMSFQPLSLLTFSSAVTILGRSAPTIAKTNEKKHACLSKLAGQCSNT